MIKIQPSAKSSIHRRLLLFLVPTPDGIYHRTAAAHPTLHL